MTAVTDDGLRPTHRPITPALTPHELPQRLQPWLAGAKASVAAPFKGLTADGNVVPGLFPRQSTGVSLAPVVAAAQAFLACLTSEQKRAATLDLDTPDWRSWCNMHPYIMRHGVCLDYLEAPQQEAAFALLRASLSEEGFKAARNVMKLNEHLREITNRPQEYGEWFFWLSIMGTPSTTEPWGWQIDGHHLILNCVVCGDQMVLSPTFLGSEPVFARSGKYAGTRVFESEETRGLAFMNALTPEQQRKATIGMDLPPDGWGTAFQDNIVMGYQGIPYAELSAAQQARLIGLVGLYINAMRPEHAAIRLKEIEAHLSQTYFAWIGYHDEDSPFYYRIHSPVIFIEFAHQRGTALVSEKHTKNHTHLIVRTPNGNDYGKALLREYRGK